MYTAHYDHLGINPKLPGDKIYNGFVDNGTGCGMLLELARAFSRSAARPPHPVLFASVTAEEKGLLGSEYLGKHLPIPPSEIALDLNYDAIEPLGIPEGVNVTGADRTTFYPVVQKTAQAFGYEIRAGCRAGRRTLLPLGSLQPGARGRARVLHQYLDQVPRASARVGQGEAR